MKYWLIVYRVDGYIDVKNKATTEDPFDFIIRMNKVAKDRMVNLTNFWEITKEQYEKLSKVF